MATQSDLIPCGNCRRPIGLMETPHVHQEVVVCAECKARLLSQSGQQTITTSELPYKALGIEKRSMAWAVFIVGAILSTVIVGIPMMIWGCLADRMLYYRERDSLRLSTGNPDALPTLPSLFTIAIVLLLIGLIAIALIGTMSR